MGDAVLVGVQHLRDAEAVMRPAVEARRSEGFEVIARG